MNHHAPAPADLGHNQGPATEADALRQRLTESHADLLARIAALEEAAGRVPTVTDDDVCGRATDFVKQCTAATKKAEAARKEEKEPFLESGRVVDAFFKAHAERLDKALKPVKANIEAYLRQKAEEEERRRREEAARAAEAARQAEEEARQKAEAMASEQDMDAALAAEAAQREAAERAAAAEKEAAAKAADMSRTRGEYGGTATLATVWTFKDLDRQQIDLNALRPYLPQDALEKAVRAAIRAGVRDIKGVTIFQDRKASIR